MSCDDGLGVALSPGVQLAALALGQWLPQAETHALANGSVDFYLAHWAPPTGVALGSTYTVPIAQTELGVAFLLRVDAGGRASRLQVAAGGQYPPSQLLADFVFADFATSVSAFDARFQLQGAVAVRREPPRECVVGTYKCTKSTIPSGQTYAPINMFRTGLADF